MIALDASAEMLRLARTRHGAAAVLADALAFPFADTTADAIILAYVLFHLADPLRALAEAKLDLQEYRLRQAINEGLGYRNFNAFLNRYRIDDAKAALCEPSQREVPVLTIAMDAGFQSIGPFNRAFKADTGTTPTEFRREALAGSQAATPESDGSLKIGQSR